ncbi:hypothetical protein LTR85_007572 [Meristemomyces frigidus]|nr:hypothetical protein LTR85_007572 [Meristemomyces frigidus]
MMRQRLGKWLKKTGDKVDSSERTPLLLFLPGHGGTYNFNHGTDHIAFGSCYDTVGVYFPIDQDRYFAANIEVRVLTEEPDRTLMVRTTAPSESRTILGVRDGVIARLQAQPWASLVLSQNPSTRDSLVMTGSWASGGILQKSLIQHAVETALQAFFQCPDRKLGKRDGNAAVVLRLPNPKVEERAEHWLEARDWSVLTADEGRETWQFGVLA